LAKQQDKMIPMICKPNVHINNSETKLAHGTEAKRLRRWTGYDTIRYDILFALKN